MLDSLLNLSIQGAEVLLRKIPRICPYFRVSQKKRKKYFRVSQKKEKKILQGEPELETKNIDLAPGEEERSLPSLQEHASKGLFYVNA